MYACIAENNVTSYRYGFQGQEHDEEVLDYVYEYTEWDSIADTTYKDYLSFDGVSDFVDCGSVDRNITDNLSIEAWIRTTANSTFSNPDVIVSDYQFTGYHLLLRDGKVALEGRNGNDNIFKRAISTQTVNDGEWHHVVGVADLNDTWHIYVDGVLANAVDYNIPNPNFTNTNHLYISRIWDGRFKFEGDIRDVSLWNRVRSAGEVYYDYKTGHPAGNESGLVAYFPLNEGSGTTATDLSPTGINGSITGATWQSETIIDTNLIGLDSIRVPNRASQDFGERLYFSRIGRLPTIDPLVAKYPYYSPYSFAGNMGVNAVDANGLEPIVVNGKIRGYRVEAGQGPSQIAADLNDPSTQKKYGYTLQKTVDYKDVVSQNKETFEKKGNFESKDWINNPNDAGYTRLNINQGETLIFRQQENTKKREFKAPERKLLETSFARGGREPMGDFQLWGQIFGSLFGGLDSYLKERENLNIPSVETNEPVTNTEVGNDNPFWGNMNAEISTNDGPPTGGWDNFPESTPDKPTYPRYFKSKDSKWGVTLREMTIKYSDDSSINYREFVNNETGNIQRDTVIKGKNTDTVKGNVVLHLNR